MFRVSAPLLFLRSSSPQFSTLTLLATVHTMIVEQYEEGGDTVRIIRKDVPAEYNELIQKFRLIDDTFFNVCFDNYAEGMQLLLRIFFGRDDLVVKHVVTQQSADNLYGRGVRFDVLAEDSEGKLYDCEVQRANKGAAPRRARYNSSMMDARELAKSAEFSDLPETWVIFITENDIYGAGCPLYHVERIIEELQRPFNDGAHILYVNGANRDDTPLGRLMQDFFCENPKQMNYKELAERADYFKAEAEGVNAMCELMEKFGERKMEEGRMEGREAGLIEGRAEGRIEGRVEGRMESARRTAAALLALGKLTFAQIAEATQLPMEEVERLSAITGV